MGVHTPAPRSASHTEPPLMPGSMESSTIASYAFSVASQWPSTPSSATSTA